MVSYLILNLDRFILINFMHYSNLILVGLFTGICDELSILSEINDHKKLVSENEISFIKMHIKSSFIVILSESFYILFQRKCKKH